MATERIPLPQKSPGLLKSQATPEIQFHNISNQPQSGLQIHYRIGTQEYLDRDVDLWELRASRRALGNLKTLLYGTPMLDLVKVQCGQGDVWFKSLLAASNGRWCECRTNMHVVGVGVRDIMDARNRLSAMDERDRTLRTLLPAHPEHYAKSVGEGQEGVIEVIGEHMMSLRMVVTDDVPDFVRAYADPAYPFKKPTVVKLQDGTTAYYILHEFREVEDGCSLRLRVVFPAAAPEIMFSEHAEHMAIEFRFGIKTIYSGFF
ncbi:hypothetical protein MBLNU459_g3508t1 [Dothideomycetes sp. NU459]